MKTYSYILIDHDQDGRTCEVISTPIVFFHGKNQKESVRNNIRIIVKHMADGDFSRIVEMGKRVEQEHEPQKTPNLDKSIFAFEEPKSLKTKKWEKFKRMSG